MMKRIGYNLDDIRQTSNGWLLCFSFNCTVVAWPRTQWELHYKVFINGLGLSVFFLFVFVSGHVCGLCLWHSLDLPSEPAHEIMVLIT